MTAESKPGAGFLLSALAAELAAQCLRLTLLWRATELGGSTRYVAVVLFAEAAMALLSGFALGGLLDRLDPKRVAIAANVWRALGCLGFLVARSPRGLVVAVLLFGVADGLYAPARTALAARLADGAALLSLNARIGAMQGIALVLGPVAFVAARSGGGAPLLFSLLAFSYAASAALLVGTHLAAASRSAGPDGYREQLLAGLRTIAASEPLRVGFWIYALGIVFASAFYPLVPALCARIAPAASETALGVVVVAIGLGGIAGALAAPRIIGRAAAGRTVLVALLLDGLCFGAFALPLGLHAAAAVSFAWGVVMLVSFIALVTLFQRESPDERRGQVLALLLPLQGSGVAMAYALVALLTPALSESHLALAGGVALALSAGAIACFPSGRRFAAFGAQRN